VYQGCTQYSKSTSRSLFTTLGTLYRISEGQPTSVNLLKPKLKGRSLPRLLTPQMLPAINMHALRSQQHIKQVVKIHHRIHMGMEQRPLWHLSHNMPQFCLHHALLGKTKHHTRIHIRARLLRQDIIKSGGPYRGLFFGADSGDDVAGFTGDGGEGLSECVVWEFSLVSTGVENGGKGFTAPSFLLFCNESFTARDVLGDERLLKTWDPLAHLNPFVVWDLRGPFYVLDSGLHDGVLEATHGIGARIKLSEVCLRSEIPTCSSREINWAL